MSDLRGHSRTEQVLIDSLFFSVVVPGPLVDGGKKLAFDRSPLLIIPPFVKLSFYNTCQFTNKVTQTELTYLDREDQKQAWTFNLIVF